MKKSVKKFATAPRICARSVWAGDIQECRRLYHQFANYFDGSFAGICSYYGWKRAPMLHALRQGKSSK